MLAHSISVLRLGKALSVAQPLCGIQNCTNDDMTVMKSLGLSIIVELCSSAGSATLRSAENPRASKKRFKAEYTNILSS